MLDLRTPSDLHCDLINTETSLVRHATSGKYFPTEFLEPSVFTFSDELFSDMIHLDDYIEALMYTLDCCACTRWIIDLDY